jgi:hypothetical protein
MHYSYAEWASRVCYLTREDKGSMPHVLHHRYRWYGNKRCWFGGYMHVDLNGWVFDKNGPA